MEQQFFNNMSEKVVDDLRKTVVAGSKLSIAAASFSLYAFETLKNELWKIDSLRFIFTSKTFVKKQTAKESREFDISKSARECALNEEQSARERSLFGSEFELKLRNQLNQKAIAVECAEWIRQKVKFRTNVTDLNFQTFMHVKQPDDDALYTPFNEFSAVGLGVEKGNNISNFSMRVSAPLSNDYINKFNECWFDESQFEEVTQGPEDQMERQIARAELMQLAQLVPEEKRMDLVGAITSTLDDNQFIRRFNQAVFDGVSPEVMRLQQQIQQQQIQFQNQIQQMAQANQELKNQNANRVMELEKEAFKQNNENARMVAKIQQKNNEQILNQLGV